MSRWVDDEGRCTVCGDWARDCDCRPCERCGDHFRMDDLDYLTPDDWDSPLWCEACREASACLYCGAQMSEDEGPYCGACFAAMYGPTDGGAA